MAFGGVPEDEALVVKGDLEAGDENPQTLDPKPWTPDVGHTKP